MPPLSCADAPCRPLIFRLLIDSVSDFRHFFASPFHYYFILRLRQRFAILSPLLPLIRFRRPLRLIFSFIFAFSPF
jgi:hypothetical protein